MGAFVSLGNGYARNARTGRLVRLNDFFPAGTLAPQSAVMPDGLSGAGLGDYVSNGNGTATLTEDGSLWALSGNYPQGATVTNGDDVGAMISPTSSSSGSSSSSASGVTGLITSILGAGTQVAGTILGRKPTTATATGQATGTSPLTWGLLGLGLLYFGSQFFGKKSS